MINSLGWVVGYFAASQSLSVPQDAFVKDSNGVATLPVPSGYSDGRALCINGKTNTPDPYRIGGWKRTSTGVPKPMLWKLDSGVWVSETISDPDGVLTGKIAWIADINDNGVCVGRIDGTDPSYGEDNEQGGLFIYDPGDKVRRINLSGLVHAYPVRINDSKEIAVNRDENNTKKPYIVFPPSPTNSAIRGSVVDFVALIAPGTSPDVTEVFEFNSDRRFCGVNHTTTVHSPFVAKQSTSDLAVAPNTITVTGFTSDYGNDASLGLLDGDTRRYTFSGNGDHIIELYYEVPGVAINSFTVRPTVRALTAGNYSAVQEHWSWQFGTGSWGTLFSSQPIYFDYSTLLGNTNNQTVYFSHEGKTKIKVRLFFSAEMTSGTPAIELERLAINLSS